MSADADKHDEGRRGPGACGRSALHRFLLQLVHDLRSPINAAAMWLSVLEEKEQPVETRRALAAIQRGFDRQGRILSELAAAVAAEDGGPELRLVRTPAFEFLQQVRATATQVLGQPPLGTIDTEVLVGHVDIDADRLLQAFAAIAGTLAPAGAAGIEIDGLIRREDAQLVLTVRAPDCTVPAAKLHALLEVPWCRSPDAYGGKGLAPGLYVARRTIEAHGGTLAALEGRNCGGAALEIMLPWQA